MDLAALISTSIAASLTGLGLAYLMRRTVAAVAVTARRNRHRG